MRLARTLLFGLALALLGSCKGMESVPLDHLDLGSFTVVSYQMPHDDHRASGYAQRLVGKTFTFGPDRIAFPLDFGVPDCQHQGYRLTERAAAYLPPFELGQAGTYSLADAEIRDERLLEVWNFCVSGVYLSTDHQTMYVPGRGALFILQRQ